MIRTAKLDMFTITRSGAMFSCQDLFVVRLREP